MEVLDNLSLCEQFSDHSSPPFSVGKLLEVDVDSISPSTFDMSGSSCGSGEQPDGLDDPRPENPQTGDDDKEKPKDLSIGNESCPGSATSGQKRNLASENVTANNDTNADLEGSSRWNYYQNFLDLAQPLGPMPPQAHSGGGGDVGKYSQQSNVTSNNAPSSTNPTGPRTVLPLTTHEHSHPVCHTNLYADFNLYQPHQTANPFPNYGNSANDYQLPKAGYHGSFAYLPQQLQGAPPMGHSYSAGPWVRPYYTLPVRKRPYKGPNDNESPGEPDSSTGAAPTPEPRGDGGESPHGPSVSNVGPVASLGSAMTQRTGPYTRGRRVCFSTSQIQELEKSFLKSQYCNTDERKLLAEKLELNETQIKNWFQNRRSKEKRRQKKEVILSALTRPNITLDSCGPELPDVRIPSQDKTHTPPPTPPTPPPSSVPTAEPYPTVMPPWSYHQYPQSVMPGCGMVTQPSPAAWNPQPVGMFGPGGFHNPYAVCYPGYPYLQVDHYRSQMASDQEPKVKDDSTERADVKKETA
ncbi:homeobox protein Hmx isoform X2 [Lingula anatina]|uniref:Homeobox protein Hmx isoform X2 n=1 Tax=Lingula anatina TaxID=7574 RepID=A0A1S3JZS3_LINAN|nr:homeobox protein Hmx isoform X2 [Lingula anatina]|eukprot:XP_013415883.1 homeobox protein Hmx isoform X2 [Lingula anatina]